MSKLNSKIALMERCERCGLPIDRCVCVCPYCGETAHCTCCIGYGVATGG